VANNERLRERIDKLLRLAAPKSGATEAERISAALEAARLVDEHDITFGANGHAQRPSRISRNAWTVSIALDHVSCSHCHQKISPRDIVWLRVCEGNRVEYRHNYRPCAIA
jgi:hypothetical protein